jgi:hypothetical protein
MRILVLLLLLANLTMLGYTQLDRWAARQDGRLKQQVNAERITLLTPQQVAALSPAKAELVSNECMDWGPFTESERERAQALLDPFSLGKLLTSRHADTKSAYWVFLAPLPGKAAADKRVAELKRAGISDLYVITDNGPQKNAISLGVFKSEEAAQAYLDTLVNKGVRNARVGSRTQSITQTVFTVRDPQPALTARLEAAKGEFAGTEIVRRACDQS